MRLSDSSSNLRNLFSRVPNGRFMLLWSVLISSSTLLTFLWPEYVSRAYASWTIAVVTAPLLVFFPGSGVLRIIGWDHSDRAIRFCLSVGVSLLLQMLVLACACALLTQLGVDRPLAENKPVVWILAENVILLSVLLHRSRRPTDTYSVAKPSHDYAKNIPAISFPPLIVILALLGAVVSSRGWGNSIQMVALVGILVLIAFPPFTGRVPRGLWSWWILCAGIAMMSFAPLASNHIYGTDMAAEYAAFSNVYKQGNWMADDSANLGNILSVSLLPVALSSAFQASGEIVFRTAIPFLMGLLPLSMFLMLKGLFPDRVAYLSVSFFLSFNTMFVLSISDARMGFSEFFICLILILAFRDKRPNNISRSALYLMLIAGMIVSYYSATIVFVIALGFAIVFKQILIGPNRGLIARPLVGAFSIVAFLIWYIFTAEGQMFSSIVEIGQEVYDNLFSSIFSSYSRDPTMKLMLTLDAGSTPLYATMVWVYRLTQFMVIAGAVLMVHDAVKRRSSLGIARLEYTGFVLAGLLLLVVSVVQPYFVKTGIVRMYQMTLVFLSPAFIIGAEWSFRKILSFQPFRRLPRTRDERKAVVILILVPYFLLSSGIVAAVAQDEYQVSVVLSDDAMQSSTDPFEVIRGRNYEITDAEVTSAIWIANCRDSNITTYADDLSAGTILVAYGGLRIGTDTRVLSYASSTEGYVYWTDIQVNNGYFIRRDSSYSFLEWEILEPEFVYEFLDRSNLLYSNGDCEIRLRG